MRRRTRVTSDLVALMLALGIARESAGGGPDLFQPDSNAVREYAHKYYLVYREKYGLLLRIQQMLKACDLEQLAAQVNDDVPKVPIFAAQQIAADRESAPPELSTREMTSAVILATQNLTEEYELAYLDAFKLAAKTNSACTGVAKVYDTYLKTKEK